MRRSQFILLAASALAVCAFLPSGIESKRSSQPPERRSSKQIVEPIKSSIQVKNADDGAASSFYLLQAVENLYDDVDALLQKTSVDSVHVNHLQQLMHQLKSFRSRWDGASGEGRVQLLKELMSYDLSPLKHDDTIWAYWVEQESAKVMKALMEDAEDGEEEENLMTKSSFSTDKGPYEQVTSINSIASYIIQVLLWIFKFGWTLAMRNPVLALFIVGFLLTKWMGSSSKAVVGQEGAEEEKHDTTASRAVPSDQVEVPSVTGADMRIEEEEHREAKAEEVQEEPEAGEEEDEGDDSNQQEEGYGEGNGEGNEREGEGEETETGPFGNGDGDYDGNGGDDDDDVDSEASVCPEDEQELLDYTESSSDTVSMEPPYTSSHEDENEGIASNTRSPPAGLGSAEYENKSEKGIESPHDSEEEQQKEEEKDDNNVGESGNDDHATEDEKEQREMNPKEDRAGADASVGSTVASLNQMRIGEHAAAEDPSEKPTSTASSPGTEVSRAQQWLERRQYQERQESAAATSRQRLHQPQPIGGQVLTQSRVIGPARKREEFRAVGGGRGGEQGVGGGGGLGHTTGVEGFSPFGSGSKGFSLFEEALSPRASPPPLFAEPPTSALNSSLATKVTMSREIGALGQSIQAPVPVEVKAEKEDLKGRTRPSGSATVPKWGSRHMSNTMRIMEKVFKDGKLNAMMKKLVKDLHATREPALVNYAQEYELKYITGACAVTVKDNLTGEGLLDDNGNPQGFIQGPARYGVPTSHGDWMRFYTLEGILDLVPRNVQAVRELVAGNQPTFPVDRTERHMCFPFFSSTDAQQSVGSAEAQEKKFSSKVLNSATSSAFRKGGAAAVVTNVQQHERRPQQSEHLLAMEREVANVKGRAGGQGPGAGVGVIGGERVRSDSSSLHGSPTRWVEQRGYEGINQAAVGMAGPPLTHILGQQQQQQHTGLVHIGILPPTHQQPQRQAGQEFHQVHNHHQQHQQQAQGGDFSIGTNRYASPVFLRYTMSSNNVQQGGGGGGGGGDQHMRPAYMRTHSDELQYSSSSSLSSSSSSPSVRALGSLAMSPSSSPPPPPPMLPMYGGGSRSISSSALTNTAARGGGGGGGGGGRGGGGGGVGGGGGRMYGRGGNRLPFARGNGAQGRALEGGTARGGGGGREGRGGRGGGGGGGSPDVYWKGG